MISLTDILRASWHIFKRHAWFFLGFALVMVILNIVPDDNLIIKIVATVASIVVSYMWLSIALAAVDGKDELLTFANLRQHFPTVKNLILFLVTGILGGLAMLAGFIALIIPGIYIMTRFALANFAYVDGKGKPTDALRYSWRLVTRDVFWKVLLAILMACVLAIIGIILLGIGFLITYPITMLMLAGLYRALEKRKAAGATTPTPPPTPEAPAEILAPTPAQ